MVRATRATQLALDDPPVPAETNLSPTSSSLGSNKKATGRKRKRTLTGEEHDREPLTVSQVKEVNGGDAKETSEEEGQEGDKDVKMMSPKMVAAKRQKVAQVKDKETTKAADDTESSKPRHLDAGDAILSSTDAKHLLAILESLDGADLLEQQFSLPSSSKDANLSVCLRSMLAETTTTYSLRDLSNAIHAATPKTLSLSRATSHSQQATYEQNFVDTALGLLDQIASQHSGAIDPTRTNLDPDVGESTKSLAEDRRSTKKYALYQQLPSGSFFTSAASMTPQEAASLPKGQASLVLIQPTVTLDSSLLPKLGSYSRTLKPTPIFPNRLPTSRRVAMGSFLDYGSYASFAPVFDSEAGELGDQDLADYLYSKQVRKAKRIPRATVSAMKDDGDIVMELNHQEKENKANAAAVASSSSSSFVIDPALEMEDELRAAMEQVQLETGIDDLLASNASAIQRLVQLQNERYKVGAKAPEVEVGGEEWKLAHTILSSLTTLTSLRPRVAGSSSAPLVPPPAMLRALHRSIPTDPVPGWKGTLARDRDVAYRDNSTITPGATPYVNPTPVVAPAPVPPPTQYAPSKATHQQSHAQVQQQQAAAAAAQYSYGGQQYQHRPGMVGSPAQSQSYYGAQQHNPHAAYYAQQQAQAQAQAQAAAAYQASIAASGGAKAPVQGGYYYPYPNYGYNYPQYPQQYAAPGTPTASMPGTPQPGVSRAIPNLAKPGSYAPAAGWGTPVGAAAGAGGAALPMHLRTGPATPGTPTHGVYGGAAPVYPPTAGAYVPAPAAGYAAAWPPQKA
ncbi:hypothetical protein FRB94_000226 [Tulasnella sp. JGI-2019a]|nr:hypothetical protein FRB94_000226 [Tulasnella sp. JGI-2019a]KAG9015317.1 hypothetical protein FRB93_013017 [Tulasnella sp. JGI-2019a]KAG9039379.1 hypothetical protein FRB95_010667 [Tulasnella sp. JGI-2019a]